LFIGARFAAGFPSHMKLPSYRLGRLWGIDVFVHCTFLIILLYYGIPEWTEAKKAGFSNRDAFHSVANLITLICGIFCCVVLHEYGHALTARRFGVGTVNITLYPIGGVALLNNIPEKPKHELIIAVMGPAVNLVIILILLAVYGVANFINWEHFQHQNAGMTQSMMVWGGFLRNIFWANVAMIVFNLIPAFPMDGGRVLRALLAMKYDRVRATDFAAFVAKCLAVAMGVYGFMSNHDFLPIIALFVWMGATQEAAFVRYQATRKYHEPELE